MFQENLWNEIASQHSQTPYIQPWASVVTSDFRKNKVKGLFIIMDCVESKMQNNVNIDSDVDSVQCTWIQTRSCKIICYVRSVVKIYIRLVSDQKWRLSIKLKLFVLSEWRRIHDNMYACFDSLAVRRTALPKLSTYHICRCWIAWQKRGDRAGEWERTA